MGLDGKGEKSHHVAKYSLFSVHLSVIEPTVAAGSPGLPSSAFSSLPPSSGSFVETETRNGCGTASWACGEKKRHTCSIPWHLARAAFRGEAERTVRSCRRPPSWGCNGWQGRKKDKEAACRSHGGVRGRRKRFHLGPTGGAIHSFCIRSARSIPTLSIHSVARHERHGRKRERGVLVIPFLFFAPGLFFTNLHRRLPFEKEGRKEFAFFSSLPFYRWRSS